MQPPLPQPQSAAPSQGPGLTWVLKVFLGFAQLSHLDHQCDAWDQTTESGRSEAWEQMGQMGTMGLDG